MKKARILAANFLLLASMNTMATGIPVVDVLNTAQATISAIENVNHTLAMAEAYKKQIEQLDDQLKNSLAPPAWIWDQSDRTLDAALGTVDALSPMLSGTGLDDYINSFKSIESYTKNKNCYKDTTCMSGVISDMQQAQDIRSKQQVLANQAAMRNVMAQQQQISRDANTLRSLQRNAEGANGRNAAIQAGNQLMSAQVTNLLQLRQILLTQQQLQGAQAQAQTENDAQLRARNRQMFRETDTVRNANDGAKF